MVTKKVNRLLKIHDKFLFITIIFCSIFILLFLAFLLLAIPNPILIFVVIASVAPGCWLFVKVLFGYKAKLENDIDKMLTKIIKQEIVKELNSQNIYCEFDVKPSYHNSKNIAYIFHFYYSDVKLYGRLSCIISKIREYINAYLQDLHHIVIFLEEDCDMQTNNIVV